MEDARQNVDPMSSMPLLNMNDKDGDRANNDPSWSDQDIEEFSQAPLEGVLRSVMHRPRAITRQQCVLSAAFVSTCAFTLGCAFALIISPLFCDVGHYHGFKREKVGKIILESVNPYSVRNILRPQSYAGKHPHYPRAMVTRRLFVSGLITAAVLGGILGAFLGYRITKKRNLSGECVVGHMSLLSFNDSNLTTLILNEINGVHIRDVLSNISAKPHVAGSEQNFVVANYIRDLWTLNGLKNVRLVPYNVLLSHPNQENSNVVQVKNTSTDSIVVESSAFQSPILPGEKSASSWSAFVAYSPAGQATGDLVYVNYGRDEDFKWISENGIDLKGKIVIARYGKYFRGSIVHLAEQNGAAGVILYSDPKDYAAEGRNKVYPTSFWLPDTAIQSGTIMELIGDPTTPGYPSVDGAFRLSEKNFKLPGIPVQPISYRDAEKILGLMEGLESPHDWRGSLNVSYKIGPGFKKKSLQVALNVKNEKKMTTIYNVIGIIPGLEEPDRYVLVGNHHDSWIFGGIDPGSGTAVVTELTRVFGQLYKRGWKPRRTIVFCSWDAEEFGLIGSTEWVEEHQKLLASRGVAYVNVDVAVEGNFSAFGRASPLLHDVLFNSAKKIPNPSMAEVAQGRLTVYDTWLHTSNTTSHTPEVHLLGAGSDFAPFNYIVGVPSCDYSYSTNMKVYPAGNPLYHSMYETFHAVDKLLDPDFKYHVAVTQLCGETIRALADTPVLPFNATSYGEAVQNAFMSFKRQYGALLKANNISLDSLDVAIQRFFNATRAFESSLTLKNLKDPSILRIVNDKLMQLERAFIIPDGVPESYSKHVLISPSSTDSYSGKYFPALIHVLSLTHSSGGNVVNSTEFEKHLAQLMYCVNSATLGLSWNLEMGEI